MTDDWVLWTIFDHFCWVGTLSMALDHSELWHFKHLGQEYKLLDALLSNWSNVLHFRTLLNNSQYHFVAILYHIESVFLLIWTIWSYSNSYDHSQQTFTDTLTNSLGPFYPFRTILVHIRSTYLQLLYETMEVFNWIQLKQVLYRGKSLLMIEFKPLLIVLDHFQL